MNTYIFYTPEGYTYPPHAGKEVENAKYWDLQTETIRKKQEKTLSKKIHGLSNAVLTQIWQYAKKLSSDDKSHCSIRQRKTR